MDTEGANHTERFDRQTKRGYIDDMMNRILIQAKNINFVREALRARGFKLGRKGWMKGKQPTGIFWDGKDQEWFTVIDL